MPPTLALWVRPGMRCPYSSSMTFQLRPCCPMPRSSHLVASSSQKRRLAPCTDPRGVPWNGQACASVGC
eukprot:361401-Chlamydomonas_euryale.AAC.11